MHLGQGKDKLFLQMPNKSWTSVRFPKPMPEVEAE
jgi:hypothetical protein